MSFLLRAALVIGALSYLAATRDLPGRTRAGPAATSSFAAGHEASPAAAEGSINGSIAGPAMGSTLLATVGSATAAWSALPAETRQRLAQEAALELGRHAGSASASRDTLAEADRKAAWRGAEAR